MFRERWPIGLLAAMLVAGGLLYWEWEKPEMYRTEATLLFEPRTDRVVPIEDVVDMSLQAGQLNTHREWIQSRTFYDYVASFFTDEEIERIQAPYRDPDDPNARPPNIGSIIRPNISAYIRRNTTIIGITARHKNPETAAFIADRYARRYIDFNLDRSITGTQAAIVFLQNQAAELRERVERAERELQEYRGRHNVASLEENQNIVLQRVQRLGGEIVGAQIQRLNLESELAKIDQSIEEEKDLTGIPFIKSYGSIAGLLEQRDNLKAERDRLSLDFLGRHPQMIANQRSLDSVDERIQRNIERAISDLRGRHAAAIQHEERLEMELLQAERESLELDRLTVHYRFLEREAEAARNSLTQIVRRLDDANIAAQLEIVNIRIFDSAWTPGSPVEPNMKKMAMQSGMLALLIFFGLPIGIGLIDNRLKASWDVEELWGGKPLGEIPMIRRMKRKRRPHVILDSKHEGASQAFLGIYSQLQMVDNGGQHRSFLITSTLPKEGKSFVANNLAVTFAQHGKRTLLVDADFRAPTIHGFYGQSNKEGLLKALRVPETIDRDPLDNPYMGVYCPHEHLHVLNTGGIHRRPSQFLEGEAFSTVMSNARKHYEIVIVDSPPLGIFPDALLLSRYLDGLFFVCRFNRVNKSRLKVQMERVREMKTELNGIIVNAIPCGGRSALYDYHGFGSYSDREYSKYYAKAE